MQQDPVFPSGAWPATTGAPPPFPASPSRLGKRRMPMDDSAFHRAKRILSEQLYNLQISEGPGLPTGLPFGEDMPSAPQEEEEEVVAEEEDAADMDASTEAEEKAKAALRSLLLGDKRRHRDKVEEKIEKLVRASLANGNPSVTGPVLCLCDAPWSVIAEAKSSRMDTSAEPGDSEDVDGTYTGANTTTMLPVLGAPADLTITPPLMTESFSPVPFLPMPTVPPSSPPAPAPFAWTTPGITTSTPLSPPPLSQPQLDQPSQGFRTLNATDMDYYGDL